MHYVDRDFIRLPVDAPPDRITTTLQGHTGPVLLFGPPPPDSARLVHQVRRASAKARPVFLATTRLWDLRRADADDLSAAGLAGVELPLPTVDALRLDQLTGEPGSLEQTVTTARRLHRAGVELWVRVPLGQLNRAALSELAQFVTSRLLGVSRLLVHCIGSLSRPVTPTTGSTPAALAPALFATLVELESARIRCGVEHRDGLPLCLFADEAEPLRYFRCRPSANAGRSAGWLYALEAEPQHLQREAACHQCALETECPGPRRGLTAAGLGVFVTPLDSAEQALPSTSPETTTQGSIFHGAPRRLGGFASFASAWFPEQGVREVPVNHRLQIAPRDFAAAGLDRVRLDGFRLILARVPPPETRDLEAPLAPSLALINLTAFAREAGAQVHPEDCRVTVRRDPVLRQTLQSLLRGDSDKVAASPTDLQPLARGLVSAWDPDTDLLGLSLENTSCVPLGQAMARAWKQRGGGTVVLGGRGMGDPFRLIKESPDVDFCVHGEGEVPLLMLCDALQRGAGLADVPGLLRRGLDGGLEDTAGVVHSLDLHPVPQVQGLDLDVYGGLPILDPDKPIFPYQFIVGCPHACAFCAEFDRYKYRVRRPDLVVRDLRYLHDELGRDQIFFVNNLINVSRQYLEAWLDEMERAKLPIEWCDCCRPTGLRAEHLHRMRGVGCQSLTWGLDLLSQSLNKRLWKNLNLERAAQLLGYAHDAGIRNFVNFIVGVPTETESDIVESIDYLHRHAHLIDDLHIGLYDYGHGSPLDRWPARFGLVKTHGGVDEVDGRPWTELRKINAEVAERVQAAVAGEIRISRY